LSKKVKRRRPLFTQHFSLRRELLTWVLKVLGVWLIIDSIGSWLYDTKKQNDEDADLPHLIEHAIRFARMLIGTYIAAT
jgi:hypothetical protein